MKIIMVYNRESGETRPLCDPTTCGGCSLKRPATREPVHYTEHHLLAQRERQAEADVRQRQGRSGLTPTTESEREAAEFLVRNFGKSFEDQLNAIRKGREG